MTKVDTSMKSRAFGCSRWIMRQAVADLKPEAMLAEIKFRLKQSPHVTYQSAEKSAVSYAATFAARLIWC